MLKLKAECEKAIDLAIEWTLRCQKMDEKEKNYGAFHYDFIWHDAEAIRALLSTYRRTKNKELLRRAKLAGDLLCRLQYKDNPKDKLYGSLETPAYTPQKRIAPSDIFEAIPGIVELYRETRDSKYLDCARLAGDWLIKHAVCGKGMMGQVFDAEKWESICPLPIHDEATFLLLFQETKDEKYLKTFNDQVDILLRKQDTLGTWYCHGYQWDFDVPSSGRSQYWFTYPLLAAYQAFKKGECLVACIRSCDRLLRLQMWDGSIPGLLGTDGRPFDVPTCEGNDGTATAMAVILWLNLYRILKQQSYLEASLRAIDFMLRSQYRDPEEKDKFGAFYHSKIYREGKWKDYVKDTGTFYGIMALEEYIKLCCSLRLK